MADGYRFLEGLTHADYAYEAFGKDLSELFVNAGLALCSAMFELDTVQKKHERLISLRSTEIDQLLHDFLEEVIFYKDAEYFATAGVEALVKKTSDGYQVVGKLIGEEINPEKHTLHMDVKSVTYHLFKVEEQEGGWRAQVILDV